MLKKFLAPIFILGLILGAVISIFVWQNKQTDNWQSYNFSGGKNYPGLEIKYPATWNFRETFATGTADKIIMFNDYNNSQTMEILISQHSFFEEFYKPQEKYLGPLATANIRENLFGYVFQNKYNYKTAYYFPIRETGYVSIQFTSDLNSQTTKQILATIKFLAQQSQTENWLTYKSTVYNFSLKYPPNWYAQREYDSNTNFSILIANKKLAPQEMAGKNYQSLSITILKPGYKLQNNDFISVNTDLTEIIKKRNGFWNAEKEFNGLNKKTLIIGNKEAVRYLGTNNQTITPWYLKIEENIFEFSKVNFTNGHSTEDQILSTVKFD